MTEKHYQPNGESSASNSDWPTLIERAVDDVSRILRSEAQMFQTSISAAVELHISKSVTLLAVISLMITGALCILCSAILLLHQSLPWWQAFGAAGLATLLAAIAITLAMRARLAAKT